MKHLEAYLVCNPVYLGKIDRSVSRGDAITLSVNSGGDKVLVIHFIDGSEKVYPQTEDLELLKRMTKKAYESGLDSQVILCQYSDDAAAYLRQTSVGIRKPSKKEEFEVREMPQEKESKIKGTESNREPKEKVGPKSFAVSGESDTVHSKVDTSMEGAGARFAPKIKNGDHLVAESKKSIPLGKR